MSWYNKQKKDTRDVTVYHASPEKISRFRPLSNLKGVKGLYFSPSYKSAIMDWSNVVRSSKPQKHPIYQKRQKMLDELDKLENVIYKTTNPQEKELLRQQIDTLSDQFKQTNDKWWGENYKEHEKTYPSYKYVFLHKVSVPKHVYDKAVDSWKEISKDFGMHNVFFWAWGEQIFIPADFLNELKVINVKKLSSKDISQAYSDLMPRHQVGTYGDPDHPANWEKKKN